MNYVGNKVLIIYKYKYINKVVQDVFIIISQRIFREHSMITYQMTILTSNNSFNQPPLSNIPAAIFMDPVTLDPPRVPSDTATYQQWLDYYNLCCTTWQGYTFDYDKSILPTLNGSITSPGGPQLPSPSTYSIQTQYPGAGHQYRSYTLTDNYNVSSDPKSQTGFFTYAPASGTDASLNNDCGVDSLNVNSGKFSTKNIRWMQDESRNVGLVYCDPAQVTFDVNGHCHTYIKAIDYNGIKPTSLSDFGSGGPVTNTSINFGYYTNNNYSSPYTLGNAGCYNLYLNYDLYGLTFYDQTQNNTLAVGEIAYTYYTSITTQNPKVSVDYFDGTVLFSTDISSTYSNASCITDNITDITDISTILPHLIKVKAINSNTYSVEDLNANTFDVSFGKLFKGKQSNYKFGQRFAASFYGGSPFPPNNGTGSLCRPASISNSHALIQEAIMNSEPTGEGHTRPNVYKFNSYPAYLSLTTMANTYDSTQTQYLQVPNMISNMNFNDRIIVVKKIMFI